MAFPGCHPDRLESRSHRSRTARAGGINGGRQMQDKLVEFANLLRQNGVRVSLAETLDAIRASDVTGLGERDLFRAALRTTMVKRASELPVFEELFDVYFTGL